MSWSHNIELLNKTKTLLEYEWYAEKIIENGWSLSVLEDRLEMKTYERQAISEKATCRKFRQVQEKVTNGNLMKIQLFGIPEQLNSQAKIKEC